MATYTAKQYSAELDRRLNEIKNGKEIAGIFLETHRMMSNRIFINGRRANMSKIGSYSTKPMLAGRAAFEGLNKAAFKPTQVSSSSLSTKKKSSRDLWLALPNRKTGKKNKALPIMVIEGGYKEYKGLVNRNNATVNFFLRGRLKTDFANSFKRTGAVWTSGITNANNQLIHDGLEKKYGKDVWMLSKVERRFMVNEFAKLGLKVLGQ